MGERVVTPTQKKVIALNTIPLQSNVIILPISYTGRKMLKYCSIFDFNSLDDILYLFQLKSILKRSNVDYLI